MKRQIFLIIGIVLSVLLLGCITSPDANPKVTIALQLNPDSALVQIAQEKGFFAQNGLDVELKEFTAGKFAFQAMLANNSDLSVVGDVPIALATIQGNDFQVLSSIGENFNEAPVLVQDDGSATAQEFFQKTKRTLSTSQGGTPEYSTYLFLKENQISTSQVEIIAQKPEEMPPSLINGSVDAIVIFEPYPSVAEEALAGKTKRFQLKHGTYAANYLLAANTKWLNAHFDQAIAVLKSLRMAEQFAQENPSEAQNIVAKRTKFKREMVQKIWSDFDLRVRISEYVIPNWINESIWAMDTNKAKQGPIPDFNSLLRTDLLEASN